MNRYLVHVEYSARTGWAYGTGHLTVEATVPVRVETEFNVHDDLNMEEHAKAIRTFQVNSLREAESLAVYLAAYVPGTKVYVAEIKAVAQSTANPAIISNVTEKGVVPR